ncbi:MAG: hypothetical protein KatS3mg053_2241 [Candidatus Roseilinea sp.]|nr:MAG: hypothetical protein KatS3mg053_2241 [Candidatus Roseilinea sp.]
MFLTITAKQVGLRAPLFPAWQLPVDEILPNPIALRDLIAFIVRSEVEAFRERQQAHRLTRVLSANDIARGTDHGKVDAGGRDSRQTVDVAEAIETALQAFEDGSYFVFVDEQQIEHLDTLVRIYPETQVLFMRLVALAGG